MSVLETETVDLDTVPVFQIDDELWESFSVEEVSKQIGRMAADGRLDEWPNGGKPFLIRVSRDAILGMLRPSTHDRNSERSKVFCDFYIVPTNAAPGQGFDLKSRTTWLFVVRYPNVALDRTEEILDMIVADSTFDPKSILARWRDRNDFYFMREWPTDTSREARFWLERTAVNVLLICLHDRRVNRNEIEPRKSKLAKLGIGKPRSLTGQCVTVLYIPQRVYQHSDGTHARPKMHFRAEHTRMQAIGKRGQGMHKEITIAGTWINLNDAEPEDRGTPLARHYKLKR